MYTLEKFKPYITLFILIAILLVSCEKSDKETPLPITKYTVILPDGDETLHKGIRAKIVWSAPIHTKVNIDLYQGPNFIYSIEKMLVTDGVVYMWTISDIVPDGPDYYIKVSNSADETIFGKNEVGFKIDKYVQKLSSFTDERDGEVYKTTKIGNQWWMAENFRYESEGSLWYKNDKSKYEHLGKLYTQSDAKFEAPDGWHLPTMEEWDQLEKYLGSNMVLALKEDGETAFNNVYGGYYNDCVPAFGHVIFESHLWSATESVDGNPFCIIFHYHGNKYVSIPTICHKGSYVRYVKD